MPELSTNRDVASLLHPFTNPASHEQEGALVITRGDGVWVYDEEDKAYLEAASGLWCASLGFNEPRLAEAAYKQLKTLPFMHLFGSRSHSPAIELAERILKLAPVQMSKVFFANSGSEAADTVVKIVWFFSNALGRPEKKKIIARRDGFHGSTVAAASLTGIFRNHRKFDLPIPNIIHASRPHYYRGARLGESEDAYASRLASELDQQILAEGPDTVAAMIAEPVMGAGGVLLPPAGYFEKVQQVTDRYGMLFIADEVICGFGRTGNLWGSQTFGIRPDILTTAKQLSAAYAPISAVVVNQRVYDVLRQGSDEVGTFAHGFTYSGHPVSTAVALECLKIYEEIDVVERVRRLAPRLQQGLRERYADHPLVGEIRGVGLMAAVELVREKSTGQPFDPALGVGPHCMARAVERGVILRALGDSIAFSPPLIVSEAEIDQILDRFGEALRDTAEWLAGR
ncbi:MAG: aminotransferase [Bryobacterales bacterium]|nr:aminotransferase [Bryobacterales bacterium]